MDRSEFYIDPEMFRFMLNDSETPIHVKMMILIAYTTGMRSCEFWGCVGRRSSSTVRNQRFAFCAAWMANT